MGTNILVTGADFSSSAVGFDAAVTANLVGLWFFNRGVRESRRNLAVGGVDAEVFGAPSDQGLFLRFKGLSNFFQTDISDSVEFTHIAAVKTVDTLADSQHSPMYVSNFGSGSAAGYVSSGLSGASIYCNSASSITMSASRYTDGTQTTVTSGGAPLSITSASMWKLVASRSRANRSQRDNLSEDIAGAGNYTTNRVLAAGDFRIGSSYSSSWTGEADIAAVAMFSRYIDDVELSTMATQLRNALAHIGVAV
ncbi:MAG TPA: hypothetical protein VGO22_18625 [Pseudorhizobium sp.]|jgi:hypothetical protein|nr:hypothetical protein [Pseudorhizobium sp.]